MGLSFFDAFRLSWGNIVQYKKKSIAIIITIASLFGVVLGLNFITVGIKDTILASSAGQTDGKVYAEVRYDEQARNIDHKYIETPEEISQVSFEPILDKNNDEKIRERVAEFGGEIVGYYWIYQLDFPYRVVTKSAVEQFIDYTLWDKLPENQIPVIMSEEWEPSQYAGSFTKRIDGVTYRVGSIPGNGIERPTLAGFNPLNVILVQLPPSRNDELWLVDDGSGDAERFIRAQIEVYLSEGVRSYGVAPVQKIAIARFDDYRQALSFTDPGEQVLGVNIYANSQYFAQDLFGTTLSVSSTFNLWRAMLVALGVILLVVAVLVAVITFAHLINQDSATIALYRAMGANTRNIYLIYFLYLVELCLLAIAAMIIIALLSIGILTLTSVGALAENLQLFYGLNYLPKVTLLKIDGTFWAIAGAVMLVAPLSLLFTLRNFSAKNISRRLKED